MSTFKTPLVLRETAEPPTPDVGHVALYSTDGSALLLKDDAGNITTLTGGGGSGGGGAVAAAGSKISALPAVTTPADTDELAVNQLGTSKKLNLNQLTSYIESRGRQNNASIAAQGAGFAADTYLTGSYVPIPAGRLQPKSKYRLRFHASKTAAGTATPIVTVRLGTAGTTADAARATLTHTAQTAAVDTMVYDLSVNFRAVGTTAVITALGVLDHTLAATGFSVSNTSIINAVSASFDATTANLGIGVSVNGGTSAAWTVQLVEAEVYNLA